MAGLTGRLRRPGAPTRLFAEPSVASEAPVPLPAVRNEADLTAGFKSYFELRGKAVPQSAIDRELREMLRRLSNSDVAPSTNESATGAGHAASR